MAVLMVKPDGTSNAKAGDYVVTGGGIFLKNADGSSTKVDSLPGNIAPKGTTTSYKAVQAAYDMISNATGLGGGLGTPDGSNRNESIAPGVGESGNIDPVMWESGYTNTDYSYMTTTGSGGSSSALSVIVSVAILLVLFGTTIDLIGGK